MPRRRGSRSTSSEQDGRCVKSKKSAPATAPIKSGLMDNSGDAADATTLDTAVVANLGYLHKKFKKVAATFMHPEPTPCIQHPTLQCPELVPAPTLPVTPPPPPAPPVLAALPEHHLPLTPPPKSSVHPVLKDDKNVDADGHPVRNKGGRYVCPYCQHACAKPSVLEKHIRAHTNERPYPCVPCGFAFKTKSNLYKHCKSRTHVLKLEETASGAADKASILQAGLPEISAGSAGSDTSDDNVVEDSDDAELEAPLLPAAVADPAAPAASAASATVDPVVLPEKFKTPYKPKFHVFKPSSEESPPESIDGVDGAATLPALPALPAPENMQMQMQRVASPGFLQERISQIISKNAAIVETLDPIWPRRYIRTVSRNDSAPAQPPATQPPLLPAAVPLLVAGSPRIKIPSRERSCSLSTADPSGASIRPQLKMAAAGSEVAADPLNDNARKRCYSEGLAHSVRNLLHHPAEGKSARLDPLPESYLHPQNPEGSIIKDLLLKSRGLPTAELPAKTSSFSVNALLSSVGADASPEAIEHTPKKQKLCDGSDPASAFHRPMDSTTPTPTLNANADSKGPSAQYAGSRVTPTLQLFGGEVEIRDGYQRKVIRIDPSGRTSPSDALLPADANAYGSDVSHYSASSASSSTLVTIAKPGLNSGGGVVQVQQPRSVSILPINLNSSGGLAFDCLPLPPPASGLAHLFTPPGQPPHIPGIPGPYSTSGWLPPSNLPGCVTTSTWIPESTVTTSASLNVPQITVHPPTAEERTDSGFDEATDGSVPAGSIQHSAETRRPNFLALKPGTFALKKTGMAGIGDGGLPNLMVSGCGGAGVTLISPETPRPRKPVRQLYLNGHAYTYLGLKCSTRVYYCCQSRSQPMYVIQECDAKLSMYSQWKTRPCDADSSPLGVAGPVDAMSLYDSRQRPADTCVARSREQRRMVLTHSSYWTNRDRPATSSANQKPPLTSPEPAQPANHNWSGTSETEEKASVAVRAEAVQGEPEEASTGRSASGVVSGSDPAKRVRIFAGGFKSNEEYTYVRGRGRGRYVCEECGIRCKKPSMLKKHIRTHTDLRPYTCRQCNFSFKTKGNLTKHMKSKAHHKKCTELGIVPVPTSVEDSNIDEDSLARQESLKKLAGSNCGNNEPESDLSDEEDDEDEDEDEDVEEEEDEADETGQFEDADAPSELAIRNPPGRNEREQEVARSLLDLGVMAPAGNKPTTYPYASHPHPEGPSGRCSIKPVSVQLPELKTEEEEPIADESEFHAEAQVSPGSKLQQPMDLSAPRSCDPRPDAAEMLPVTSAGTLAAASESASASVSPASSASSTPSSSMLASIYMSPPKVTSVISSSGSGRKDPAESGNAHNGMLQAYLTEKALKEGFMKRQQLKESLPAGSGNLPEAPPAILTDLIRPNVIREMNAVTSGCSRPMPVFSESLTGRGRPEFVIPSSGSGFGSNSTPAAFKLTDDGKTACSICSKVFTKASQLRLHINIHYFERPFRCDACAVSFRTKGHLQKHKRSVTHFNKVNMNLTFGTPSTENPRPFKCSDCMIAFRIHGHLAKHLRSKMHIMKLECLGKLPFGTYAEMERSGISLNEIDTTDCHNSLESLQSLAHRLYKQDPSKLQQWQHEVQVTSDSTMRERTISGSSEEFSDMLEDGDDIDEDGEDSDGLPDGAVEAMRKNVTSGSLDAPLPQSPASADVSTPPPSTAAVAGRIQHPAMFCSACGESCVSEEAFHIHVKEKHPPDLQSPPLAPAPALPPPPELSPPPIPPRSPVHVESPTLPPPPPPPATPPTPATDLSRRTPVELSHPHELSKILPATSNHWNRGPDLPYTQRTLYHPPPAPSAPSAPAVAPVAPVAPVAAAAPAPSLPPGWPRPPSFLNDFMGIGLPPHWHQDPAAIAWMASRHMMLPLTLAAPHPHNYSSNSSSITSGGHAHLHNGTADKLIFPCEICGKSFTAKDTLRQHMMAHAQPRPFVCEFCDAGFTTQQHLDSHVILHQPRTS